MIIPSTHMGPGVIVVHYHELWLKRHNRKFFLAKLASAIRQALEGNTLERITRPGDRLLIWLGDGASLEETRKRLDRVFGIVFYAVARTTERSLGAVELAAWKEIEPLQFASFAVRAKRSDKTFPLRVPEIEAAVGRFLLGKLQAAGRDVRVHLDEPELTCHIEITPGPALVYVKRIPGAGGMPPNTAGRMMCLLSGGFDSAVAAYLMMKRGAHLSFAHFYGAGAQPGESSVHVVRALVGKLVPYEFTAKLYRVPFENIQREIVHSAPEKYRILLYRRMMLRIAEQLARRDHALAIVSGDSLAQVASQTLQNMVAVGTAAHMPVFRPLAGMDKLEILALARKIGTYEISAEPFHDCCPVFLPRNPALHATTQELEAAEAQIDVMGLVRQGLENTKVDRLRYAAGRVEEVEDFAAVEPDPFRLSGNAQAGKQYSGGMIERLRR